MVTDEEEREGRDYWHVERIDVRRGGYLNMLYCRGNVVGIFTMEDWIELNKQIGLTVVEEDE